MEDTHFRRAYSLGSSDKPKKKATSTSSYELLQSHSERPGPPQVPENASDGKPPSESYIRIYVFVAAHMC